MSLRRWNLEADFDNLPESDHRLKIYPNELEAQYEFENFQVSLSYDRTISGISLLWDNIWEFP